MKRFIIFILLLALLSSHSYSQESNTDYSGPDYFPLRVGMQWDYFVYYAFIGDQLLYSKEIYAEESGIFKCRHVYSEEMIQHFRYRKEGSKVYKIYEDDSELLILDMEAKTGEFFGEVNEQYKDEETGEIIESHLWHQVLDDDYTWEYGDLAYSNCILIQYVLVHDDYITRKEYVYAPNIGLVREVTHSADSESANYKPF